MEFYSLISIILPNLFHKEEDYVNRYCNPRLIRIGLKTIMDKRGSSNEYELNYIVNHFMIRRLKKDVLDDLPEKVRQIFRVKIRGKQK